ncbi:FACT complex subunit [Spiromyces aspiralis]|uniref:FACT complex subunit n=1 Tax=Spiromyces aspiralis TaxID=68401 RepID=A0ACC1HCY4_9FUNG|nr:FACT complex subunit [Spiromyces aspiralis]
MRNFRVGSSVTSSRTFDLRVNLFGNQDIQFSNLNREEYNNLLEYMRDKNLKVLSEIGDENTVSFAGMEPSSDEGGSIKGESGGEEDESSPDEDFVAESESDVPEEYNEDYESSGGGEESGED